MILFLSRVVCFMVFGFMKKYAYIYLISTLICLVVLIGHFVASHGEYGKYFFWKDEADTGMDFVNCLAEAVGGEPYSKYQSSYPSVASAYFYALESMLPKEVTSIIPKTHDDVVGLRRTPLDLRTHQSVLMLLILHSVLSAMIIFCAVIYKFRHYGTLPAMAMGAAAISSYGCISALERGNIILLSSGLLMIFLFGYNSPDRMIRILSYLCLVLASCIKMYPALFALMLFDGKRSRKSLAITLSCMFLTGSGLTVAAFQLFRGFKDIPVFVSNLLSFNGGSGDDIMYRYGMRGIVEHFVTELFKRTDILLLSKDTIGSVMLLVAVLGLGFSLYMHLRRHDDPYMAAFDIALIAVLVQTQSSDYTLTLFIPVLLMLIYADPSIDVISIGYLALLMVFVLPYYTRPLSDPYGLTVHHADIVQLALLVSSGFEIIAAVYGLPSWDRLRHRASLTSVKQASI